MSRTSRSAGRVTRTPRPRVPGAGANSAATLTVRVDLGPAGAVGPGKIKLLELIGETGSISAAGRAMGMSYRQAWLLIDSLNQAFREPSVATLSGGARGGGAQLTPFGRQVVELYRAIETGALRAVAPELASMAGLTGTDGRKAAEDGGPSSTAARRAKRDGQTGRAKSSPLKRGSRKTRS